MNPPPFSYVLYKENYIGELKKYGYKTHLNVKIVVKLKTKLEMHIFIFYHLYYERPHFYF